MSSVSMEEMDMSAEALGINMSNYNMDEHLEALENQGDKGDDIESEDEDFEDFEDEDNQHFHASPNYNNRSDDNYLAGIDVRHLHNMEFHERSQEYYSHVKVKNELKANEKMEKEKEDCTFSPNIERSQERRTIEEFLENQVNLEEKRQERLKLQIREKEMENSSKYQIKPEINSISQVISSEYMKKEVTERLTRNKERGIIREEKTREYRSILESGSTYRPMIGRRAKKLKREVKIDEWLYLDAKRRKRNGDIKEKEGIVHRSRDITKKFEEKKGGGNIYRNNTSDRAHTQASSPTRTLRSTNTKYILSKFKKDLKREFMKEDPNCGKITYSGMENIFRGMNLIHSNNLESEYKSILVELWDILQGEKYSGISKDNLGICMAAILHIDLMGEVSDVEDFPFTIYIAEGIDNINTTTTPTSIGHFDLHSNYILSDEEKQLLHKKFNILYVNRQRRNIALYNTQEEELPQFRPRLGCKSIDIANRKKERTGRLDCSFVDSLLDQGLNSLVFKRKVREIKDKTEQAVIYNYNSNQRCTFQPTIISLTDGKIDQMRKRIIKGSINLDTRSKSRTNPRASKNRWDDLYNLSKTKISQEEKTSEDIDLEHNADQFTFHPKISKFPKKETVAQKSKKFGGNKDVNAAIERVKKARMEREMIKDARSRGYTHTGGYYTGHIKFKGQLPPSSNTKKRKTLGKQNLENRETAQAIKIPVTNRNQTVKLDDPSPKPAQEREPLILIDVNLGDTEERILIYEKTENATIVAKDFAQKHNLDDGMAEKLTELIQLQMAELESSQ